MDDYLRWGGMVTSVDLFVVDDGDIHQKQLKKKIE